jgi:hypothetical protein
MDEAVTLYDQICNHPSFGRTSMILFLNKVPNPNLTLNPNPNPNP